LSSHRAGGSQDRLAYRLPQGAQFQLLADHRGDAWDFLVLVNDPQSALDGKSGGLSIEIVDPRLPSTPLGQFAKSKVAALRAQLTIADPIAGGSDTGHMADVSNATLATLAARLDQETRPGELVWSFCRMTVNTELHAPVLEFAPGEPDYPSDVDIWEEIRTLAHGTSREPYLKPMSVPHHRDGRFALVNAGHESVTRDPRIRDLVISTVESLHAASASPGGRHAQSQP
jgi:hypothetical protein